jgi:hypothetical protein
MAIYGAISKYLSKLYLRLDGVAQISPFQRPRGVCTKCGRFKDLPLSSVDNITMRNALTVPFFFA